MRRVLFCCIVITGLIILPARVLGIVFLNIQWNEDREEWETRRLYLEGEGLSLNRSYQNAYGRHMSLPEGPPFIITEDIIVENTYDEYNEVDDWGSLTVTTAGEGTAPFTLEFRPSRWRGRSINVKCHGACLDRRHFERSDHIQGILQHK